MAVNTTYALAGGALVVLVFVIVLVVLLLRPKIPTAETLKGMTPTEVAEIKLGVLKKIDPAALAELNTEQVQAMVEEQVANLSNAQLLAVIAKLTVAQCLWLPRESVQRFDTSTFQILSEGQINAIKPKFSEIQKAAFYTCEEISAKISTLSTFVDGLSVYQVQQCIPNNLFAQFTDAVLLSLAPKLSFSPKVGSQLLHLESLFIPRHDPDSALYFIADSLKQDQIQAINYQFFTQVLYRTRYFSKIFNSSKLPATAASWLPEDLIYNDSCTAIKNEAANTPLKQALKARCLAKFPA